MFTHFKKATAKADQEPRKPKGISRRSAMAIAVAAPLSAKLTSAALASADVVDALVKRSEEQAKLFNAGEMQRWYDFVRLGENFTLMAPFGGPVNHGFEGSPEQLADLARKFRNGTAKVEIEASYASEDLIVLAYIERQDGEVHGLPNQDWSLRVTQVFKREDNDWRLVHRHADPLVRRLSLEKTAAIARGE